MATSFLDQQVCNISSVPFLDQVHHQLRAHHYHPGNFTQTRVVPIVLQVIPKYGKDESA